MDEEGGDADDRVVFRSDGVHTYFASDLGYLVNRFETRGFHRVIEVWGADHHGYVPRMKQACAALGIDPGRLVIILNQFVTLKDGKMSKRAGRFVTLEELLDEVGPDAVRWFYLSRAPETMMEFDLELATTHNKTNPVYYVQYAHARLAGIERTAAGRRLPAEADVALLDKPWELDLARQLAHWPDTVAEATRLMEPHRLPYFIYELADRVSTFYEAGNDNGEFRVVVDDPGLTRARLELTRAARAILRSGLDLVGVSAPERMDRIPEEE
jgi:arginyl-tRNA synthetase